MCPQNPGDGLSVAKTVAGMTAGGYSPSTILIVGFNRIVAEDADKWKVVEAKTLAVVDGIALIRMFGFGADLSGGAIPLPGRTSAGRDLGGANLGGADLTGADLGGADLTGANLRWAYLTEANLYGANLAEANLYGADLTGANLGGADLTGRTSTGRTSPGRMDGTTGMTSSPGVPSDEVAARLRRIPYRPGHDGQDLPLRVPIRRT